MVHKKYTYKDGKRFGPYYYETKRIDGHVVTTYLGTSLPHKKIHLSLIKNILIVLAFVLLIISAYFISSGITGNVSLDIKTNYNFGEQITGDLELNVFEGELIPADSIVLVEYGNFSKEFTLSDLISSEKIEGNFYTKGNDLSGEGLGYGLAGKKVEYPELKFDFYLIEDDSSGSSEEQKSQETTQEENIEDSETETNVESEPTSAETSDSSESSSESQSSDGAGITGAVISENIVSGKVSKNNDYSYALNEGDSAELVSGSVFYDNEMLDDGSIDFSVKDNEVVVTTDYSIELEGFGSEYLGEDSTTLLIDIGSLELIADKEDDFKISLIYDDSVIVESSESISILNSPSGAESSNSEYGVIVPPNESSNSSIVDIVNDTLTNETIINQTLIENVTSINQTIINETLIEVKTVQYGAVIGQPVKWVKTVSVDSKDSLNLTIEIPAGAENVTVNKIIEEDFVEDVQVSESDDADIVIGITGEVTADIDLERESFFDKIFKFLRITGRAVEEDIQTQEVSVELAPQDVAVEVEYYTDAPVAVENAVHENFKIVSVSSPEDVHYENVLVYTSIPDSSKIREISSVKIEWVENSTVLNVSLFNDTNSDGYIDYIEWIAPHLSNQTFNIILIISALHLDENRNFLSDIYNETRELDEVWSEIIPDSHYVRVTFEVNLTNVNDITIFPRASGGTNISEVVIDVYEKGSNYSLVQFSNLVENQYNKVFLTGLNGSQDTFDLLVSGGSVEFDHIIDPTVRLNGPAGDVDIIPINNVTYVIAWINSTGNNTQFSVMNPNGTVVVPPVTVQTAVGVYSRVALAPINQTHFVIGWVNQSSADELNAIYNVNGTRLTAPQFWDGAIGANRYDVGLAQIGNRYGYCYVDQAEGDVDFAARFNNGSRVFAGHGESDIDTASTPETNRGNLVDCAAVNSTTFGVVWYDAGATDDVLVRFLNASATNITNAQIRNIDTAVGTTAAVAMSSLDFNRTVVVFYDNADQDITMTVLGHDNSTYLAATDIETAAGTASSVDVVTVRNSTMDNFVVLWYNKSTEDIVARSYYGNTSPITSQFIIENFPQNYGGNSSSANNTFSLFAAAGRDPGSGNSLCPGGFVVSYTNVTNSSIVKSYWINGSEWDGSCASATLIYPVFDADFNVTPLNNSAYVSGATYRFNITITNSNGTAGLEFNGTNRSVTNLTSTMFNASLTNLGAGNYSYYWWSYGASSAYNISSVRNYVVARNSTPLLNLTFNATQSNVYILNDTNIFVNGSIILGDPSATLLLYKNGTQINQAATEVTNSTSFNTIFGIYNMTVIYNQSQNYTQGFRTYNVTVLPGPYKNITLHDVPDNMTGTGVTLDTTYSTTDGAEILIVQVVTWGLSADVIPDEALFDGSTMTRVGTGTFNPLANINSEVYYLLTPSIGDSLRLTINLPGGGANAINAAAFTLRGVNLTAPVENYNYTNTSLWNVTTYIQTSAFKSWLVDALAVVSNPVTPESAINVTMDLDSGTSVAGFKENVFPGLNSMAWTWETGSQHVAHFVASFRPSFDVDTISPRVILNAPANNSFYNFSDVVNFNWTAIDNRDTSMLCNLTIGSNVNKSGVVSPNNTATNVTVEGFLIGTHLWNVTCYDDSTNFGFNGTRRFTVLNSIPYNGSAIVLNTSRGTNKTLDNLTVTTTLFDLNNHGMNVTVRWYNNSVLHLTENYNNTYSNGTTFIATLHHGNTTKEHTWYANLTINDPFNITLGLESNNLSVLDSLPNITLLTPLNNSLVNHTNQNYTWVMGDDDFPEFVAVIAANWSSLALSSCNDPTFNGSTAHNLPTATSYYFAPPVMLECPSYLWSIIGFSTALGDWASYFRINVTGNIPNITLNAPANNTDFIVGTNVTFNWTIIDNNSTFSNTSFCNLTIDNAVNKSNINSSNYVNPPTYVSNNITSNGFSAGTHHWNMTCIDFVGNFNRSQTRSFTFYDYPNVTFISPTPANNTVQSATSIFTNVTSYGGSYHTSFVDMNRDLLLWLRFDNLNASNDPTDYSTYSRNGSKFGNAVQNSSGYFGKGFSFDGNGDYVEVPGQIYDLDQGTVSLWFKNLGDNGGNNVITGSLDGGDNRAPTIYVSSTQLFWEFKELTAQNPGVEIIDEEWYHVVLTYNLSSVVRVYLNGNLVDEKTSGGDGLDFYDTFYVGRYGNFGSLFFNGTIDDVIVLNRSITQSEVSGLYAALSSSQDYYERNFTGLSVGSYVFNATVQDSFGNINNSILRVNISITNSAPYNGTALIINSTLGLNRTLEDLNVRTQLLDVDNNAMNVTVRWYNNSVIHLVQMFNSSYSNGTTFIATLDDRNTTRGHNWTAGLTISDGTTHFNVNSSNLTIRNSPPNSTLISPPNGTITLNRTNQNFTFVTSDDDGDQYYEEINFTLIAQSTCVDNNYKGQGWYAVENGINQFSLYDSGSGPFNCLTDNGDYYLWSVRVGDDIEYGPATSTSRFDVQAYLNFIMNISSVEFGNIEYLKFNDTSDNSPKPIIIINEGNVKSDGNIGASSLWKSVNNPSRYYQFKVDNATTNGISENGTFRSTTSPIIYTNLSLYPTTSNFVNGFNYTDHVDSMEVDLNVTVPNTEGPGFKNSTITFVLSLSSEEQYA